MADLLALLCVMFSFVFGHFPIWCLGSGVVFVLIPDLAFFFTLNWWSIDDWTLKRNAQTRLQLAIH